MIIEGASNLLNELESMTFHKKLLLGACFLRKHIVYVEQFDEAYGERLLPYYIVVIDEITSRLGRGNKLPPPDDRAKEIHGLIPDTEMFSGVEGTLAQNALAAAWYLLDYAQNKGKDSLINSLERFFESIDALNQASETPLDDAFVFKDEIEFIILVTDKIKKIDISDPASIAVILEMC